jgi:hypothetical protein
LNSVALAPQASVIEYFRIGTNWEILSFLIAFGGALWLSIRTPFDYLVYHISIKPKNIGFADDISIAVGVQIRARTNLSLASYHIAIASYLLL